ncbi:YcxB family protein [Streptomyces sp. TLI_105]|uniref:YcxB family protein n=1 Tax=Streptomyces sp. TLI_105 TaxID=1881019 RepID=UPI000899B65A|nr:YcxB family protein [Streptomyces sp. TLI_105]SED41555.1 YcxB-like protein [Streptomyces sp. TLI_105]
MGEKLELVYSAEFAEVHEAVRVRLRSTRWWRLFRWGTRVVGALAFLVAGAGLLVGEVAEPVKLVLLGVVAVACAELVPWASARSLFRLIGSQGEARAVVDEDGGRWISRDTDMTIRWALLTRYAETPRLFVLFTDRTSGTGFAYLPKRGLAGPGDEERLRAILDRSTTRA